MEANGLELLVERLGKLNESVDEEAQAVNHALAVIEHAVEVGWGSTDGSDHRRGH